jgi:hypothetical protein
MSSYCDIEKLRNDATNHPNFTSRLSNWTSGTNGVSGCTPLNDNAPTSALTVGSCLTDSEVACYSSYKLGSTREKLDTSLTNIYNPQGSPSSTFDSNYQTTMLTGVVWAALGTTVLYYAFTKI